MKNTENIIHREDVLHGSLQADIARLTQELNEAKLKVFEFETFLRAELHDEIIEEQELTHLYKQLQKEKKEKRLSQKKKGKNYKEPSQLPLITQKTPKQLKISKTKKRLYREAMLLVHPDKFSTHKKEEELATEITSALISIYKQGTLQELQEIHTKIISQNKLSSIQIDSSKENNSIAFLQNKKEALNTELNILFKRHTYVVLSTYTNSKEYVKELQLYYQDRLFKLKKRTRKVR